MNKTLFKLLVFLMSLSLIGIILVQLYLINTSLKDNDEQFKAFLLKTKKRSLIKTNVDVNEGDKIVTLSTCEDAFRQTAGRIAVVAKLTKIN